MPHTRMLDGWSLFQKMLVAAIVVAWDTVGLGVLSTIETAMTSTYKMLDQLLTDDAGNGWQLYIRLVDHDIEQVAQQTFGDCSFWEIHLSLTCLRFMKVISTFLQEGSPQVMSWCWRVGVDPFFFQPIDTCRIINQPNYRGGQSPCSIILEDDLDTPSTHKNGG